VEFEPIDDFERELRQAFERRPAPPGLKRRLMGERSRQKTHRLRSHTVIWQRLAASLALAAVLGGAVEWRNMDQRRKGEAARQQVLTALRITNRALNQMDTQLAAHRRAAQE